MRYNWAYHPGHFISSDVDVLVDFFNENYTLEAGKVSNGNVTDIRVCDIAWVGSKPGDRFINNVLWDHIQTINGQAFGFDIQHLEPLQYTVYKSDTLGHYKWHRDTFFTRPNMYDRKLTLVMQLSDGEDYEGGDLILEDDFFVNKPDPVEMRTKGSIFVFPAFIKHTVTPVTKGIRRSLVAWAEGPKFR
jgi:predicted 2-oxoglutarate/Fe(II)-dependent dioxygenase YbiX